jgi:hypothetical protein
VTPSRAPAGPSTRSGTKAFASLRRRNKPVNSREFPGAVILGLLAALAAHMLMFGGDHAMGGAYHALLLQIALAGALSLFVFFAALTLGNADGAADGSIVAARLRERIPRAAAVLVTATAWYAVAEGIEHHHASPSPLLALLALAAASWIVLHLAGAALRALAAAVLAILGVSFTPRAPSWSRRPSTRPLLHHRLCARRLFAPPPPIAA